MDDRREHEFVTLSGVPCIVAELMGSHQRFLSENRYQKGGKGFDLLLKDCLIQIGEKRKGEITDDDINNLLAGDRKHILLTLRQFTLNYQKNFDFDYEWPVKGGRKQKQHYTVNFTTADFPLTTYGWVREKYKAAIEEAKELFDRQGKTFTEDDEAAVPIPKIYDSYEKVLEHRQYEILLPRSQKKVRMKLFDGNGETDGTKIPEDDRSSHTPLVLRNPRWVEYDEEKNKEREFIVNLDRLYFEDITELRRAYKRIEGEIDTILVIEHQTEPGKTVRINLLGIVDFFFPSVVS